MPQAVVLGVTKVIPSLRGEGGERHSSITGKWREWGKLLEAQGSSSGVGTRKAAAANMGTWCGSIGTYYILVAWAGPCREDLGICRWEIRKKPGVTGDVGEHRYKSKGNKPSLAMLYMEQLGLFCFFLDLTHFSLDMSVLKWHCFNI